MRAPPKRLAFFLSLLALSVPGAALAQTFDGDFSVSSGAVYQTAAVDEAKSVAVDTITAGGPFIYVTGDSNDVGTTVKLSSAGVALSSAAFIAGQGRAYGVAVDPSGNPWVVGLSVTGGPLTNWVVKKYNPDLVAVGSAVISGISLGDAVATSIAFDGSGNAFVAGYSSNTGTGTDFRIVKYSPSLVVLATTTYGGAGVDQATALTLDASGNVIVTGFGNPYDYKTAKFTPSLNLISSAVYDASGATDRAYGVTTDPSGNVYVTGESDPGGSNFAFTTVKYDSSLAQQAVAAYNTPSYDAGFGAVFVGTATLVVVGNSFAGATEDMLILEYGPGLVLSSSRTFDSGTSDRAYGAAKGTGTYVYVTGYSFTSPSGAYRTIRLNDSATVNPAYPGCAATNNVGGGQAYTTIQSAVDGLPSSLTGPACVVIRDGATYPEQVTVRNFANNGWPITILADPASVQRPVVSPPAASAAAFVIANASVNVQGIDIVPTNPMPYGVFISSTYVSVSGVNVKDAGGKIATAGVATSSWTTVSYTSITVGNIGAWGFFLPGSTMTSVSFSSASSNLNSAVEINGGSYNTLTQMTITTNDALFGVPALRLFESHSNTILQSYIGTESGVGGALIASSNYNTISQTTMTTTSPAGIGLYLNASSSNTITQSYIANSTALAAYIYPRSNYNLISQCTVLGGGSPGVGSTLSISLSSFNTITQSFILNPTGMSVLDMVTDSNYNTVSQSTITGAASSDYAIRIGWNASTNTFSGNYIQGSSAVWISNSSGTVITGSTLMAIKAAAVHMDGGSGNLSVSNSLLSAPGSAGIGISLAAGYTGSLVFTSNTVTGARHGMSISTQAAGAGLTISSMTFSSLASGATAMQFTGGAFVATITASSFDASVAVNVNGAMLDPASRVTMVASTGPRAGAAYEADPASLVDWWSGVTAPAAPTGFAGTVLSTGAILWSWTDSSSNEDGFRIMSGTANVSGNLAVDATTWLQAGLSVNASSGPLFAQAFNSAATADSSSATRYTLAAEPAGLAALSVFQTSATVSWTAGNPAGTIFELERSTGAGFALLASTTSAAYVDAPLGGAATYYYRVRALNNDLTATAYASSITVVTFPIPAPGAPSGFTGTAQSASAILWTWTDNADNEDGYRVLSGTISLSGDLAAGATAWPQTGLAANTAYGPYSVEAFNGGGISSSTAASRTTLAAVPSAPTAAAVALTSATIVWSASGNPAGTTFELERSTGAGYGLQASGPATYYLDTGLTPAATFYYRVRAFNADAAATAYSSTLAVVAQPLPALPGAAGTPAGTALGVSSVTWGWALASGASSYNLFRSSDNAFLASAASGPFVETALAPNTAYGLRAAGTNIAGTGPLSAAATAYTLAADPSGTGTAVTSTTIVASWALNGNPASTVAELQRSTDAVAYSTLTAGAVVSYAEADLLGCTTYYYRVRNLNGDGMATAYVSFQGVTANTVPSPPSGLNAAANAGGTVGLSWAPSPSEGVTGYRLYWDAGTGTVSYAAPLATLGASATGYTTAVLTSSASYTFALRAAHRCGTVETTGALAMSGAAAALPAVRAAIKEPDSGRRISGDRVTILGELVYGEPSDVQQVLFQYKLATSSAWLTAPAANVNHANPDLDFPYFLHWDVTVLAAGSYDLRAVAYDRDGVPDAAPPAVRIVVDPVAPDVREALNGDGKIKKDQTISNLATSVVETAGAGAGDPAVRVTLPPGVVNTTTATLSVIANPAITTAPPAGQTMIGSAIKIGLSNGQTALNGVAAITLTYPDTVRFPSLLQIYYLEEATGRWSRDFATTVNTSSRTVTGSTPHFSTFVLMLGTAFAPNLDSVQAYPVPYKPNGTNPDEGRPFSHGDANSGILFANLAAGSEIRVYTMTGRLVSSLDTPTIAGTVRWDARNQDGRDVASGAYFAVISAPGQKSVVKKLVIIR
ncbi:MAG: right-handed parallel beta-helix repeat-containing protein [Elusimicrobia bacterium]|nr:right-handed parallel beta-helix repeat-containing protein [Elusimicrobiota bacterium]